MAIEFNCPHCQHQYRLKDDLAGKTATCKTCRQKITIPQPLTIPPDAPPMDAAAAEAAALAALADEPEKVEQAETAKLIPVECNFCGHKWTEPITRAGKNALCPNPECKQRVKIPEPKDEGQYDWRQTKTKGPSLAKENQQKLEGVQDAADAKIVSGGALAAADATGIEYEPRPLKQKVLFVAAPVLLLGLMVFGVFSCYRSRSDGKHDQVMKDAQEELAKGGEALSKEEVPLFAALMHTAVGEYAVRLDTGPKFKEAMDHFAKARAALGPGASPARNAVVAELTVAMLALGGSEEQVADGLRLRWTPNAVLRTRPNERVFTVYEELQKTLQLVLPADAEFRYSLARRLTRELTKRGQGAVAVELLPVGLFAAAEQPEAKAVIALEIFRADRNSDVPKKVAAELAPRGADLVKNPQAASAQTLFLALKTEKAPTVVPAPSAAIGDGTRFAYTGFHLLEDRPAEALKIATATGKPESQLRSLTLYADWAADPGPALDAALAVLNANKDKKDSPISPATVLRLSQVAAEKGRHDQSKQFADKLTDEGLKAWAHGDAVRLRLAAAPKEKGDEAWAEAPDDPKKVRVGHAWGRLSLARHNTRLNDNRNVQVKAVSGWTSPLAAFGKAGVALGLQDK